MKISYHWLREYVDLDLSPARLEEALTLLGFEVEGRETVGLVPLPGVVVGEVVEYGQHPNADRLRLCRVRVGVGEERSIVCGATNFAEGDRVPVALPGAVLPNGMEIRVAPLRGVESEGMICSARELGLGEDHSGILVLETRPEVGLSLNEVFPEADTVFTAEVTPNRPDCLSHTGIARELAARFSLSLRWPAIERAVTDEGAPSLPGAVVVRDPAACPRYGAWSIRGVRVGPSPRWMQARLEAIGLRPVNNVVDCTNYVLHETGQPLHAFDYAKIREGILEVRRAVEGERIRTLDDRERELTTADLVIADGEGPLVVAGVMGSLDAEVDDSTRDIVLEAAHFAPAGIRATSRRLGLSTDSSYRFERGSDPLGLEYAAERCLDLILQTAGGEPGGPPHLEGSPPETITEIAVDPAEVVERLGFPVEPAEMAAAWESLGLEVFRPGGWEQPWRVRVPSFRRDLARPADLVEEFLRLYGTDRIPAGPVPGGEPSGLPEDPLELRLPEIRRYLGAHGYAEAYHYSLVPAGEVRAWLGEPAESVLELANPLASDQSHLRASLLGGLLGAVHYNRNRRRTTHRFYEVGRVFGVREGRIQEKLAVAFTWAAGPDDRAWRPRRGLDLPELLRRVEEVVRLLGLAWDPSRVRPASADRPWLPGHSGGLLGEDGWQAEWGVLSRGYLGRHGLEDPVWAAEVVVDPALVPGRGEPAAYEGLQRFPLSFRDVAVYAPRSRPAEEVRARVAGYAAAGLESFRAEEVRLFDLYEGDDLPGGRRSLAFTIAYGAPDRTLGEEEVADAFGRLCASLDADEELELRR